MKLKYSFSDIFIGLLFAGLLFGSGIMQPELKHELQVFMIMFGLLSLGALLAKQGFQTSVPFYILLGVMLYINIFVLTNQVLNFIDPDNGWVVDRTGEIQSGMQMNWIWAVLAGLVLSPPAIILYHKKISRNKLLEISLTIGFILLTAVIYVKQVIF